MKAIYNDAYRLAVRVLREARTHRGLTQVQAGRQMKRSRAWIGKVEQCEIRLDAVSFLTRHAVFGNCRTAPAACGGIRRQYASVSATFTRLR